MTVPTVSIILPTYNRARFLPQAMASIRAQTFSDWELIIIDDGSTDGTRELLPQLTAGFTQPVRSIYQENQGAYGARNTGLDHATGKYIAFFDSDDEWLPHHLKDCVEGLEANPQVDWVYGACRMVDDASGQELASNTFYIGAEPRPFLKLYTEAAGRLRVIRDARALKCMLLHGTYSGLQNSVIRRDVFDGFRFEAASRNEAEDQLIVVRALSVGRVLAYYDNVHVIYRVHNENSSVSNATASFEKNLRVLRALVEGYERLGKQLPLSRADRMALRRRLGRECFWHVGYALLWQNGRHQEALTMFRRGLHHWPWNLRCWKTFVTAVLRMKSAPRTAC